MCACVASLGTYACGMGEGGNELLNLYAQDAVTSKMIGQLMQPEDMQQVHCTCVMVVLATFSTQYDEGDLYEHFVQFYKDVLPEFSKAGKIVQFKVVSDLCCRLLFVLQQ